MLTELRSPVSPDFTHPVVFAFEQAGELRLELPAENPSTPRFTAGQPSP